MLYKTTFILFIIYFAAIEGLYERPNYPNYKYHDKLTGWISLHEEPVDWHTANNNCRDEDAVLVASSTNKFYEILAEIIKESNKTIEKIHVGSIAESQNAEIVRKDSDDKAKYCQVFDVNKITVRAYGDCNEKIPYVCFAPAPNVDCDTVEFGQDRKGWPAYNRCSKIKGWLRFHVGPVNFETARARCKAEDAQLINPYIPEFQEYAMKLLRANSTEEEPVLAVYSLAKVIHPHGFFEKYYGKLQWVAKNKEYCVIFLPQGGLGRTECEAKVSFVCYARNPAAADLVGTKLADTP